jgi:isoleucyl-tRNA synthetase
MQFEEVLRTFIAWFESASVPYALAGGNALRAWGHQRLTYEVDFVVNGTDQRRASTGNAFGSTFPSTAC